MNKNLFKNFTKGSNAPSKEITAGNAVLYNRVSSKEQEENQSLEVQLEICQAYSKRYGLTIVQQFGGVFESAKSDKERKEFNKMLSFIRRNKKLNIEYVVVYSTSRFSRTGSTTIIEELEKLGITVLSATSNYNPKTPAGKFNQRIELANANFDNESKGETTRILSKAALLKGRWVGKAPRGYDQKTTKKLQTITINNEGKLIKKAFHWKADDKLANEEIRQRLEKLGFYINKQKLSELLKNPFYCGLMVHSYLNGEIVKGNHPAIVSEETFLKANGVLSSKYTGGYEQKKEKEWAPLLGVLKCSCCGYNVTASASTKMKKKYNRDVYYYVCSRKGCKFNNQVIAIHESFTNYLSNVAVKDVNKSLFEKQLKKVYEVMNEQNKLDAQNMKTELSKLKKQLNQIELNWAIENDIKKKEILWRNVEISEKRILEIELALSKIENSILNLDDFLKYAVDLIYNPLKMWNNLRLGDKQRLQNLMFPEGILFDKKNEHIEPISINQLFEINDIESISYEDIKKELLSKKTEKSPFVPRAGLEPARTSLPTGF